MGKRTNKRHRAGDYVLAALPQWITDLFAADTRPPGALVRTLRALADADLNVLQVARWFKVHPNTVCAHPTHQCHHRPRQPTLPRPH